MSTAMRLDAPAKLNLDLRVVGRRDDGLHLLESHLVLVGLADRLLLLPGCSGLRVEGGEGQVPLDATNLAWRGLVAGMGGEPDLACLALEKRVPAAAGLGGGSSDAAAAWRLGRAWRGLDAAGDGGELAALAAIGADVPFFAAAVPSARVTGIGERVEPREPVDAAVVLVHPPFGLPTGEVFAALRPDEWGRHPNDLLPAATRCRPALAEIGEVVRRHGAEPRLSGSGPTLFVLDADGARAADLAARLTAAGLRVTTTRTRTAAASIERIDEEDA